jgi:hypothetical protein
MFENQVANTLRNWLDAEYKARAFHITDGSCKTLEEYKEKCGELRMITATGKAIDEIIAAFNDPVQKNKGETDGDGP